MEYGNQATAVVQDILDEILEEIMKDEDPELIGFYDITNIDTEKETAEESSSSSSSSSGRRGRVYRVNRGLIDDSDEDTDDGDEFFSSEDLLMKFVELEDCDEKIINDEDTDKLQVDKHVLKFELSKQLFEETLVEAGEDSLECSENSRERKRKANEELFAKLFDYERDQVETIKNGDSRASRTLNQSSLLDLENDLVGKKKRLSSCYEDIYLTPSFLTSHRTIYRSLSQPNFDSITEEESSGSDTITGEQRPILKTVSGSGNVSSNASQTDISALPASSTMRPIKAPLKKSFSIDFDRDSETSTKTVTFVDSPSSSDKRYVQYD